MYCRRLIIYSNPDVWSVVYTLQITVKGVSQVSRFYPIFMLMPPDFRNITCKRSMNTDIVSACQSLPVTPLNIG